MNIIENFNGATRRASERVSALMARAGDALRSLVLPPRKTVPLPSVLAPMSTIGQALPKPTPQNLRRFSETPVARRAINTIKDRIAGMRWRIQPRQGISLESIPDGAERVQILTQNFNSPNPDDSFRSFSEQVLEDIIVGGYGAIEVQASTDASHP